MKKVFFLLLCFSLFVASCGADDSDADNNDVSGVWNGEWNGNNEAYVGAIVIEFEQENDNLRGELVISNSPCFDECNIFGNVDSSGHTNLLIVSPDMPLVEMESLNPIASREELKNLGIDVISVAGTIVNGTFNADFDVVQWDVCTDINGVFELEKE